MSYDLKDTLLKHFTFCFSQQGNTSGSKIQLTLTWLPDHRNNNQMATKLPQFPPGGQCLGDWELTDLNAPRLKQAHFQVVLSGQSDPVL